MRDATRMLLKAEGYRVTAVESLAEAMHKVREESIDLLVTDYHLRDGETGTQVIAALRETLGCPVESRAHDRRYLLRSARAAARQSFAGREQTHQGRGAANNAQSVARRLSSRYTATRSGDFIVHADRIPVLRFA